MKKSAEGGSSKGMKGKGMTKKSDSGQQQQEEGSQLKKKSIQTEPPASAGPGDPKLASAAFERVRPELEALDPSKLARINVDVSRAVSIALGAVPKLKAMRRQFASEMPKFSIDQVDKLEDYALAAWYAHLLSMAPASPESPLRPLLEEATPLREQLLLAAEALAFFDLIDGARLAEIRSGQGYLDTASDLVALSTLFKKTWNQVKNRTAVDRAAVDRAEELGTELLVALGAREKPIDGKSAALFDFRTRAFTLFINAYDACRRAVSYLRWNEDDVESITPSIFGRFRGRSASRSVAERDGTAAPMTEGGGAQATEGAALAPAATG